MTQTLKINIPKIDKPEKKESVKNKKWDTLISIIEDWNITLRFNKLTRIIEYKRDTDDWQQLGLLINDIVKEMETKRGVASISGSKVFEMISCSDISNPYNPVQLFYDTLPEWDGVDYYSMLPNFIKLAHDEDPVFFINMMRKTFIRTLRCGIEDGYVNRIVTVFHGPQEIGKSKFWEWCTLKELYYDEEINVREKDSILALARYLIICLDELDRMQKKGIAELKAFISKNSIVKRVSYGRSDERFSRIASFVGTTNKADILADESNTRWLMLKVVNFDWRGYKKAIDPLQLWSQAKHLLNQDVDSGELTKEEKAIREWKNNSQFLETTEEGELIMQHYEDGEDLMTATEIKIELEKKFPMSRLKLVQIVRELKRIYGEPLRTSKNGVMGRYYKVQSNLKELNHYSESFDYHGSTPF